MSLTPYMEQTPNSAAPWPYPLVPTCLPALESPEPCSDLLLLSGPKQSLSMGVGGEQASQKPDLFTGTTEVSEGGEGEEGEREEKMATPHPPTHSLAEVTCC